LLRGIRHGSGRDCAHSTSGTGRHCPAIPVVSHRTGLTGHRIPIHGSGPSVDRTVGADPNIGALRELRSRTLTGLRVWPVKDFDELLIFYVADVTNVKVIRILHGRRDLDRILKTESATDDQLQ
jgi:hypothetical protein